MDQHQIDLTRQISIVIITRNRANTLLQTLHQLYQLPERFALYVVDNHSTDSTVALVIKQFPEVNLIALPKNMGAVGRNIGVQHTTTPYVAFCDDDSWWEPGALTKAVEYFDHYPDVGVIAGKILVNKERKLDPTSALQSISPLTPYASMPGPAILGFIGCQLIVRKKAFMQAGGYSKLLYFSGEEELLGWDIAANGWGMTYCDDIVGRHFPSKQRDLASRYRLGSRNVILRAWLRRPLYKAIKKMFGIQAHSPGGIYDIIGVIQGIILIPKMLRYRKVLPWWIEQQIELLEDQKEVLAQKARQKQYDFARQFQLDAR